MAPNLTIDQRKWILKNYWQSQNYEDVRRVWFATFNTPAPSRRTIKSIKDKFERTGSVATAEKSGRKKTVNTEENQMTVALAFVNSPKKSTRRAAEELGIDRSSLRRILKSLKMKPYRPALLHGLLEDDPDRRLQFCETLNDFSLNEDPEILNKIIWSDEATFKLSGHINRHNCVYWSHENPHLVLEKQNKQPGVTVWGAISTRGVIGHVFFDGTVNGENYLEMLRNFLLPALQARNDFAELYFQQDGAPPHYSLAVRAFLNQEFPQRWIGRRGSIEWPPRSPDLTPMDFFLWGVLKEQVYSRNPKTIPELRQYITDSFADINRNQELCQTVCESVLDRCHDCCDNEGRHFEHLRD